MMTCSFIETLNTRIFFEVASVFIFQIFKLF